MYSEIRRNILTAGEQLYLTDKGMASVQKIRFEYNPKECEITMTAIIWNHYRKDIVTYMQSYEIRQEIITASCTKSGIAEELYHMIEDLEILFKNMNVYDKLTEKAKEWYATGDDWKDNIWELNENDVDADIKEVSEDLSWKYTNQAIKTVMESMGL